MDVRDEAVRRAIEAPVAVAAFLDASIARSVADRVRADERHLGLIVPSMAFLDDPARCTVVLFADRVPDLGARLADWSEVTRLALASG